MTHELHHRIALLGESLMARHLMLGTAESCTGGLIAAMVTDISGSSGWFAGGIVSYSNEVKERVLGVPHTTLVQHGAVSGETVEAMMHGACTTLDVPCAVAVSGIAGPTGGTPEKPVGTVWMAACAAGHERVICHHFSGPREAVRLQTVETAVETLLELLSLSA